MFLIISSSSQRMAGKILNISAALSDILVITLFDRRFVEAWKISFKNILLLLIKPVHKRTHPAGIQTLPLGRL